MKLSDVTGGAAPDTPDAPKKLKLSDVARPETPAAAPTKLSQVQGLPAEAKPVTPEKPGFIEGVGKQFAEIPKEIGKEFSAGTEEVRAGEKQIGEGVGQHNLIDVLKGTGKMGMGALEQGAAIPSGATKVIIGDPVEKATGSKFAGQLAEDAAGVFGPGPLLKGGKEMMKAAVEFGKPVAQTIEKIFSPTTVGPEAVKAEGLVREELGKAERDTAQARTSLDTYAKTINKLPPQDQLGLIDYIETRGKGAQLSDPALQPVADTIRKVYDQRAAKIAALPSTAKTSFIDDYYQHMWKEKDAAARLGGGAPKQGSSKSLKERSIPTVADGIKAGLTPVTTNPLDQTMLYVTNMDRFLAHNSIFDKARDSGTIKFFQPGQQPEGWSELQGRLAQKAAPIPTPGGEPGARVLKAYAPADFSRVYNNFISPGFHQWETGGKVYDNVQKAMNSITMSELGLSGYHAYTMAQEAMISGLSRAIGKGARGEIVPGIKEAAKSVTPWEAASTYQTGKKFEQQYLGTANHGPDYAKIADLGTRANLRAQSSRAQNYKGSAAGSYWDAWKKGSLKTEMLGSAQNIKDAPIAGTAKEFAKAWGRTMDTVAEPIFDKMVPRLKNGVFYNEMQDWLGAHPVASDKEQVAAARQIVDTIDNRFGELNMDNLFWNKMLKQSLQLMVRAVGWDLGTLREIGGGIKDIGKGGLKDLSPRTKYILALPVVTYLGNQVWSYLKTGKPTDDPWTYQTGGKNPDGSPEKAMVPGYMKDVLGYIDNPVSEAAGKIGTGPKTVWDLLTNRDYRGLPIGDPRAGLDHPEMLPGFLKAYAQHVGESFVPMSAKNFLQRKAGSGISVPESLAGMRPAPTRMQNPERTESIREKTGATLMRRKERSDARIEQQREQ